MSPFGKMSAGLSRVVRREVLGKTIGFADDRRGNVLVLVGLGAIPVLGLLGLAVDYGTALQGKAKLDQAADAASMVAINTARDYVQNSSSSGSAVYTQAIAQGVAQAKLAFAANAGRVGYTTLPTPTVNLVQDPINPQKFTATVSYQTTMKTNMMTMLGVGQMNMGGTSTATLTSPTYINYYIITDASQSMGVGATPDDMANLYNRVIQYNNYDSSANQSAKIGCVFGCHVPQTSGGLNQTVSNETLAHDTKYGDKIKLRIDSAKDAISAILDDATKANQQSGMSLIQIGIYTMQQDPTKSGSYIQNVVSPPNSNFSATGTAVTNNMDLGNNTGGGIGDSGFDNSLDYFVNNILTAQGDGSTQAKALNYVFIITDGIFDTPGGGCTYGHCTGPLNDSKCTPIKQKATVGVIYTTYNPVYNYNDSSKGYQDAYQKLVLPSANSIASNLQACSSDSTRFYFEAQDGPGITTGMKKLFTPTIQAAMISK